MTRFTGWLGWAVVAAVAGASVLGAAGARAQQGVAASPATPVLGPDLVVHEWGTFLAMQGSDGITLDGMYHEEHALPGFVHARSTDQLRIPRAITKGETPVIYFYTNKRQPVSVTVGFPAGVWTQWYPQAERLWPELAGPVSASAPKNGRIRWSAEVIPAPTGCRQPQPSLPPAPSDALWNYSRQVDAAYVRTNNFADGRTREENERFLFYRGLGSAPLPLKLTDSADGSRRLSWDAAAREPVRHLFVVRVSGSGGAFNYIPSIAPGTTADAGLPCSRSARPMAEFTKQLGDELAARLVESGLYEKEARAMVNTWTTSYFQTPGTRVLCVMPPSWTSASLPIEIEPKPRELVRVMVGRLEILEPEREQAAEKAVRDLASTKSAERDTAFAFLRDQGRYVEPVLRRVERQTKDERVRSVCRQLLNSEFVTELRAAVSSAKDGSRVAEEPLHLKAQLVSLLRDAGLDAEARDEAKPVLAQLRAMPVAPMSSGTSRHYFRAMARASEGAGDDNVARDQYERFINYGSQVKTCGGCHALEGPRTMSWFRDWYAGRKYAEYAQRTGRLKDALAAAQAALKSNPDDAAAAMKAGYLLAAKGEQSKAEVLWARLDPTYRPVIASSRR